jgi:serine/threonine protein kinase
MTKIGNYIVKKKIGEGGFGRVFQAKHVILGEDACLKQNKRATRDDVELLIHESKLLWKLEDYHSIPTIKDFYKIEDDNGVIVMSYIEGDTLEDLVEKNGPLHPEDVCWITERLLGALYYSNCNGVIHSDVKPENVFIEPNKRDIKLIDFGLASYKPKATTKPAGFSPKYAAPEIMDGKPPIPETDIYGAGIVMLRALGGEVSSKTFRNDTPDEVKDFCEKLLRYDPRERPYWEKNNPLDLLGKVRENVFGRRHSGSGKPLKGGGS